MANILALDFGTKRIGLAIADTDLKIPSPLPFMANDATFFDLLGELIQKRHISYLVLGYPISLKAKKTQKTQEVEVFKAQLEESFKLEVILVDERLTSIQAQGILHQKGFNSKQSRSKIDSLAASLILEAHLG